MNPTAAVH